MYKFSLVLISTLLLSSFGCQNYKPNIQPNAPTALRDIPALRLNYRFEPDVPAPDAANETAQSEERNPAVQADFDQNRPQQFLDRTITSPNKKRVLAVYHEIGDLPNEFRLDMYSAEGQFLRKITHDSMAVHFPDTIVWSPDSTTVAFVAMIRGKKTDEDVENPDANSAVSPEPEVDPENPANVEPNTVEIPPIGDESAPVLTLRTEQIYIADADGENLKLLTQVEGLIYFYFVWSPDSSMLAALAATYREWDGMQKFMQDRGEVFIPAGRPRLIEKNGRERRLDDNLTIVHPVWSPDSAKVAAAFDKQIRIYDAIGDQPSQAAIPLRNEFLTSAREYEKNTKPAEETNVNANADTNANVNAKTEKTLEKATNNNTNANVAVQPGTLPDERNLVSFNPIVDLKWTKEDTLYLQTAYVKQFQESANNVRSYARWHRLILSPQAIVVQPNQNPN